MKKHTHPAISSAIQSKPRRQGIRRRLSDEKADDRQEDRKGRRPFPG